MMPTPLPSLDTSNLKVAIIGLGYVGLPLAVTFGQQRKVLGFDINPERIDALLQGHDVTLETSKDDLSSFNPFSQRISKASRACS